MGGEEKEEKKEEEKENGQSDTSMFCISMVHYLPTAESTDKQIREKKKRLEGT